MADWTLAPDGKTLVWAGAGGAPLISGDQQVALRRQLASSPAPAPAAALGPGQPISKTMVANPTPGTVTQQGAARVPTSVPQTGNAGLAFNAQYVAKGGALPGGVTYNPQNGALIANSTAFAGPNDTIVRMADGSQTVLMKNGTVVTIPAGGSEGGGGGGGGGGASRPSAPSMPAPATTNAPTKVIGPQKAKDLLPAFSPPAINQLPNFYDPGAYIPVAGSSDIPTGYTGKTAPDIGGQSSIAKILGQDWSAKTLDLTPGQNGYGMPTGNDLKNNYVDPRVYGYIAPIMNPAFYQNARSSSK